MKELIKWCKCRVGLFKPPSPLNIRMSVRPVKGNFRDCWYWDQPGPSNVNCPPQEVWDLMEQPLCGDFHNREYPTKAEAWEDFVQAVIRVLAKE